MQTMLGIEGTVLSKLDQTVCIATKKKGTKA